MGLAMSANRKDPEGLPVSVAFNGETEQLDVTIGSEHTSVEFASADDGHIGGLLGQLRERLLGICLQSSGRKK
jgi:hypothetical protein